MTGVSFIWMQWVLPTVIPAIFAVIGVYNRYNDYRDSDVHDWINKHWPQIFGVNIIVSLLLVGIFVIPMAKRWQALPEE